MNCNGLLDILNMASFDLSVMDYCEGSKDSGFGEAIESFYQRVVLDLRIVSVLLTYLATLCLVCVCGNFETAQFFGFPSLLFFRICLSFSHLHLHPPSSCSSYLGIRLPLIFQ